MYPVVLLRDLQWNVTIILRRHETEAGVGMELEVFYNQQCGVGFKMGSFDHRLYDTY